MEFGLVQSFDVDGDELGSASRGLAFTLGVEWGMAWQKAKSSAPLSIVVHAENQDRISAMLIQQGRRLARTPRALGDYVEISVAGLD